MHLLTNKNPVPTSPGSVLEPGRWLMGDAEAARIMLMAGGGECELKAIESQCLNFQHDTGWPDDIVIMRGGRYGDLVSLSPCLRALRARYKDAKITVSCFPEYREALLGLPYIDGFEPYPMSIRGDIPYVICLEPLTSLGEREKEVHLTDLFAERIGIALTHKEPDFYLSNEETDWAESNYKRIEGAKRVAIHVKSSTPSRDYPIDKLNKLIGLLHQQGWDIMLLGLPTQMNWKPPGGVEVPRITACMNDKLTFRQSAAVLATCDCFVGPDSGLIHVAGALRVPALGLFSNVPWQLRTKYHDKTFVIQSSTGCPKAPCFHAGHLGQPFPVDGPCMGERKCVALDAIQPETIIARLRQLIS